MTTQLEDILAGVLENRQLLDHPFYQRWEAGVIRRDELAHYAEQYRYFEVMFPTFLRSLCAQLPKGPIRNLVEANLADEVSPPSHVDLFEQFARAYGAREVPISPAMSRLVESYFALLQRGPASSLAGLWAYESQGGAVAVSKADGLIRHYEAPSEAVAFWAAHGLIEGDHAKWTLEALTFLGPDIVEVEFGASLIGEAWWNFLDERELLVV